MRRTFGSGAALLVVLTLGAGCATSTALQRGRLADELRDFDLAVAEYTEALRQRPGDLEATQALDRAKLRAATAHHLRGRRLSSAGRYQDAVLELQIATELDPANQEAASDLRAARAAMRAELSAPREGPTELEALLARSPDLAASGPQLPDAKLPGAITTGRQTTAGELYRTLAVVMNLTVTFDAAFRENPAEVRLEAGMPLRDALDAIGRASATFYRVTAPNAIIVVNDTPAKQREYLQEAQRLILLQNVNLKEAIDAVRIVSDARKIAPITELNGILITDTPERADALARFIRAFDKARPELIVDVEILEVNRAALREYGAQVASPGSAGIEGSLDVNREGLNLEDLRNLSRANVLTGGIPALYYRLLKTDSRTRVLANSQVRVTDGTAAKASFGQEIPVAQTVIQPIQQGGLPIQPQTTFQYRTVGVNLTMTPRAHPNDDVSLALDIELSTLAGSNVSNLPIIGTRQVVTSIRLRDGETNILGGLIRDDERTRRESIPGLGQVPVLGSIFARNRREVDQTDVVVLLTPHIIRGMSVSEDDLRPYLLPRDSIGGSLIDVGPVVPPPPPVRNPGGGGGGIGGGGGGSFPSFPVSSGPPAGTPVTTSVPSSPGAAGRGQ